MSARRVEPGNGVALAGKGFALRVHAGGAMQVDIGDEAYTIESSFSYPGQHTGTNVLSTGRAPGSAKWRPVVKRTGSLTAEVTAQSDQYRLCREVGLDGHRLAVTDTLTNTSDQDVGLILQNAASVHASVRQVLVGGASETGPHEGTSSENPTLLIVQARTQLGILAEDTLSRLQFEPEIRSNGAAFLLKHLGLQPGRSLILRWAVYPMVVNDYFAFINQIRHDWQANFTVLGPWDLLDVTLQGHLLRSPDQLAAYLKQKCPKVLAFGPWLDYDNFSAATGAPIVRQEYKVLMSQAAHAVKAIDPDIRCIGCMEGNLVSLPPEAQKRLYEVLPPEARQQGIRRFTDRQMDLIKTADLPWRDCLLTAPDGRYTYELYYRGQNGYFPMMAVAVYAAPGNSQMEHWLDQARFILEDVGLDGIYIDQFSLAFGPTPDYTEPDAVSQRYSHEQWDGVTVDINSATGQIARRYTDGALVGVHAREALIDYVLSLGGVMVANTHCAVEELQSRPIMRFLEAEWSFNPLDLACEEEPPPVGRICKGQLDSPIALGYRPGRLGTKGQQNYARVIMKSAVTYLRHGLLYYHYGTDIPHSGPGSGEYGALAHMFPCTPMRLGKGFVEARERIVSCVSGAFDWPHKQKPNILLFDMAGRPVEHRTKPSRTSDHWHIDLLLRDWEEIAVVQEPASPGS